MKVYSLPVTRSSSEIRDSFLQQLALRVNIEGKQEFNGLQILIFKPTGRPGDEFDNLIRAFKNEGGDLDEDTIFVTAGKGIGCQFKAPSKNFNFVLQTSVYLTDENKLNPRSNAAVTEIADMLIHKYGFQPCSRVNPWNEVVSGKATNEFPTESMVKVEVHGQEIYAVLQEIIQLKRNVEEHTQEIHTLQQIIIPLETIGKEIHELQQGGKCLKRKVEKHDEEIQALRQENTGLKGNGEENGEEEQRTVFPDIQFKQKRNCCLRCCLRDEIKSVNLGAIKIVITNMRKGMYDFQRTCEKELGLKPGNLPGVLEFILKKSKIQGVSRSVIEGQQLEHLIEEVTRKFELTEDHFNRLLYKIYKQNKRDKRGGISSLGEYGSL